MGARGRATEHLASVNKTLDVLEAFDLERRERSLGELSAELGIAKPTLHRILANLQSRGYVRQDPDTRRYRLGVKCWELGVVGLGGFGLRETARPLLAGLSEQTGEQTTLWLYDHGDVVCVERSESTQRVRSYTRLGAREPAHLLSVGRVLLAHGDPAEVARLRDELGTADGDAFLGDALEQIRARGYEVSEGDRWPDVYALGAPVRDHTGVVIAAIGVSGPSTRFEERVGHIAPPLVQAAAECSRQLGYAAVSAVG